MNAKTLRACGLAVLLSLAIATPSRADLLYDLYLPSPGSLTAGDGNFGFTFSTIFNINVAALGMWDEGGDGLAFSHGVGLWNGSGTLLASTTVTPTSTTVPSLAGGVGQWVFENIGSPITLPAGSYTLGFYNADGAEDAFRGGTSIIFLAGAFGSDGRADAGAPSFARPIGDSITDGWYGPNFSTTAVPEPGAIALLALTGILAIRRR